MDVQLTILVPEIAFNERAFILAIGQEIEREITIDERQLRKTHATWTSQPLWQKRFGGSLGGRFPESPKRGAMIGMIFTDDDTYNLVAKGTRSHFIFPRRGGWLRFQRSYRAKTRPRVIGSTGGGKSGELVRRKAVHHPGTQARAFHEEIARRRQLQFTKNMAKVLKREANKFFTGKGARANRRAFVAGIGG